MHDLHNAKKQIVKCLHESESTSLIKRVDLCPILRVGYLKPLTDIEMASITNN